MSKASFFKKVKTVEIIASRLVESILAGGYRSIFKGQGIEFDEVREYEEGDDSRMIDWNVTSRIGAPYTKVFREEKEVSLFLIVDMSASLFAGSGKIAKNEMAALVFAILGISAVVNNDRVGGVFFSDRIEKWVSPAKGKKHVLRLINDLLRLVPAGTGSELSLALKTVCESLKRRGICVIISDFKTDNYWAELSILASKHDVIALKISDPLDSQLPETGMIELKDTETGRVMLTGGAFKGAREKYKMYWEKHYTEWKSNCMRRGVRILEINTNDDPGWKLYQFFRKRKR